MTSKINNRIPALIRFASAITALNIAGYFYLGFEQSYANVVVALLTGYSVELLIETIRAKIEKREPKYKKGFKNLAIFLLPAHISSLAVSMLIFTNENLMGVVFGVTVALLSKVIFQVKINGRLRHFLNPSNTGIAVTFLVFPWVGSAPPYHFSEATTGYADWVLILIFVGLGTFLNAKYTKKIPLILAWLVVFFLQAVIRTSIFGTDTLAALGPMTGVAFLLFTFYMVSDPSTTPIKKRNQIIFGTSVAAVYGILMELHIVFDLFFSLLIVCSLRGTYYWITELLANIRNSNKEQTIIKRQDETKEEVIINSKERQPQEVVLN